MGARRSTVYQVEAFNTAVSSENRIHDDETARSFGFRGGLVPGVEVYAYMAHMPVARYGAAWLERGGMECRFLKPVYDGHLATITAEEDDGRLSVKVESDEGLCANANAWIREAASPPPARMAHLRVRPPVQRDEASEISLAPEKMLGIEPVVIEESLLREYLSDIRETETLYARSNFVHPGQLLRLANQALLQNVKLGPWIHVGSRVENFAIAHLGDHLALTARVASNHTHKGHAMVELDAELTANDQKLIAQIRHLAIWRPRQVAETSTSKTADS
ncbi:MAG: hypothetical protein JO094_03705 [Hyphomicrobiales bacterium]|nr:hypothetical protein [Hyphomicrobiales bacterium]